MEFKTKSTLLPAWMAIAAVALLFGIIITLAIKDLQRGREVEIQTLQEKSTVLMSSFESGARTGMGMHWRHDQRQTLLEEMAYQPNVLYIAITDRSGRILAHSDPQRVGQQLYSSQQMAELKVSSDEQWHMTTFDELQDKKQNAFEAYRWFKPLKRGSGHSGHMMNRSRISEVAEPQDDEQAVIFAAFDTVALDAAQAKDMRNTAILLSILLLLALASWFIFRDMRKIRQLQEEIRRKEKLVAMGDLAAGVAHEIRNPLSSIKGFAKYFADRSPQGSEQHELAKVMAKEVDRLNRVITELLALVRPADLRFQRLAINEVIEHSLHLIRQDAQSKNIVLRYRRCDKALPLVEIDPDRLTQVLLNLYLNAIQAMGAEGTLEVEVELTMDAAVRITVSDSGAGIPPEDLGKIFNPYFTTKATGTGLGLTMVQKVIEEHQGTIVVSRGQPAGTRFEIVIPLRHQTQQRETHADA